MSWCRNWIHQKTQAGIEYVKRLLSTSKVYSCKILYLAHFRLLFMENILDKVFQNGDSIILVHGALVRSNFARLNPKTSNCMIFGLLEMSSILRNPYSWLWFCRIIAKIQEHPKPFFEIRFLKTQNLKHRNSWERQTRMFWNLEKWKCGIEQ